MAVQRVLIARGFTPLSLGRWAVPALVGLPTGLVLAFILVPLLTMAGLQTAADLRASATNGSVQGAIWLSLESATITAAAAVLVGTPTAYVLAHRRGTVLTVAQALIDLPLAVPHTVAGIALLFVFGRRGLIGAPADAVGVQFWGAQAGIVVAMLFVSLPYLVNSARLGFESVDPRLRKVARTLGATPLDVFWQVDLPLAARGIFSGAVLTYARSISEIGSVMLLAYYPMTAPVKIYDLYLQSGLEQSSAMAVLLLLVTLSTFLVLRALVGRTWQPTSR